MAGEKFTTLVRNFVTRAIATHTADIDAHMSDFFETLRVGGYFSTAGPNGTGAITAARLQATWFFVPRTMTFDRIACCVTVGAAGNIRLGIYNVDADFIPTDLILDSGALSVAAAAIVEATISQQLTRGWYALATISDVTPTMPKHNGGAHRGYPYGLHATAFDDYRTGFSKSIAYGALPDPSGITTELVGRSSNMPLVALRVASLD
jgi:hypothetical protein